MALGKSLEWKYTTMCICIEHPMICMSLVSTAGENKIILDECSTVVEIDHVRNLIDCLERKNG